MNLNNLRCLDYLGKLIVEHHEGYGKAGTVATSSGTELELWLEMPSPCCYRHCGCDPTLCHEDCGYFQQKYFVTTSG